jgi:hypothetical protein
MQIHEITLKQQLDEALGSGLGTAAGKTVSGVKNAASFIASPFKNVAQGYKQGRADQNISMLADKAYRAWQDYSMQWAKSQGGQYTQPGKGAAPAPQAGASAQQAAGQTPAQTPAASAKQAATAKQAKPAGPATNMQTLYSTIQSLDNKQLNAIAKILSQRVGPEATMAALKKPAPGAPVSEGQLNELGWQDVKAGAQRAYQAVQPTISNIGQQVKQGVQLAPQFAKQVGQGYKKAAQTGMKMAKAAPGAIATAAGATAGAVAGMPGRAQTAYRTGKQFVSGPQMTVGELQQALFKLTPAQATKLYSFVQQLQTARKAGLKEGVTPATLLPSYEQALKAFVQKNLLSGMQYSRLQNASQIDDLIKKIVDPTNDSASAQKDLWNKLVLASSVAQHAPASGPASSTAAPSAQAGATPGAQAQQATSAGGDSPEDLIQPVTQALDSAGAKVGTLKAIGQTLARGFTNNNTAIKSTGEPAVDALLMSMGFRPQ